MRSSMMFWKVWVTEHGWKWEGHDTDVPGTEWITFMDGEVTEINGMTANGGKKDGVLSSKVHQQWAGVTARVAGDCNEEGL